jgi:hypothetical protein
MACIKPPALTDEQLLSWIDGAATVEVAMHMQQCADCRSRANSLARWQKQLAVQLYRVECPSPLELGEYHLALLPAERVLTVEKHLTACLHCAREIQTLQGYLTTLSSTLEPVAPSVASNVSLGQRVRRLVAKWIDPLLGTVESGGSVPAFAALRGEAENQDVQFVYEAEDVQIIIELQTDPTQPDRKVLLGLILGLAADQAFEAQLQQTEQAALFAPVDELGNFVFDKLMVGTYTLLLRSAETEIRIEDVKV